MPDCDVTVCDYLYPGESPEDCVNNVKEIFGWQLHEDSVEDDLEIVASPREARPVQEGYLKQRQRARGGLARAAALGLGALSLGLAWLALRGGGEEGLEVEAEL